MTATRDEVIEALGKSGPILVDFDGPVCSVFAGYPADLIAEGLRSLLAEQAVPVPPEIASQPDPLEVLRWVAGLGSTALTGDVETALSRAELRAVDSATPTPHGREVIVAATQAGRQVAVVSNNSQPAVARYLTQHRLRGHVNAIVGRDRTDPRNMKPSPEPIRRALAALGAEPTSALLIGDSVADIESAHQAGVRVVGLANKPGKVAQLATAGASVVVSSMADVALALLDAAGQ
jgi:HAD superfamily hydrolase (TIGR01509 family)